MELPIICIWHIASASNLAQRQQWNFPLGFVIALILVAVAGSNQIKPVQVSLIQLKCTWYKRESPSLVHTSALDFNKRGCVRQI